MELTGVSPGYLEEEAVHTYTSILEAIDDGRLGAWKTQAAPAIAIDYWQLEQKATMKDLILAGRTHTDKLRNCARDTYTRMNK